MADVVLVNKIIASLGLTGSAAEEKRLELGKLSNDELNKLLSNQSSFKETSLGGFSALNSKAGYSGEVFKSAIIGGDFLGIDIQQSTPHPRKDYSSRQERELTRFAADFICDSANSASSAIENYNKSVGWFNVTDRAVNGVKVFMGQEGSS